MGAIDLCHLYGNDLQIGANGDLLLSSGAEAGRQSVLRRLLTNPLDDPWTPGYGAGLPRAVGSPADAARMAGLIRAQLALEPAVAADPPPSVGVAAGTDGTVTAAIAYADADGGTQSMSLPIQSGG